MRPLLSCCSIAAKSIPTPKIKRVGCHCCIPPRRGDEAVVKLLLDSHKAGAEIKDKENRTPLSYAATKGHEVVVKLPFDRGKVDTDAEDQYGQTPLLYTAANGDKAVVKRLIAAKAMSTPKTVNMCQTGSDA
jgi:ankyrin repeat protein